MTRYRIHTQYQEELGNFVSGYFEAFSLTRQTGYWKGVQEEGCTIEIIVDKVVDHFLVEEVAKEIKRRYAQEEVWVVEEPVLLKRV